MRNKFSFRPLLPLLVLAATLCALPLVATAQYAFTFQADDQGAVTGLDVTTAFRTTLRNTGSVADTYILSVVKNLPATWTCSICQGTVCYPPYVTQLTIPLGAGAQTHIDID